MTKAAAILLAGSRPGTDPLAKAAGVAIKPLAPVAGEPMINYPARALLAHPAIGKLMILTQTPSLLTGDPATAWLGEHPCVIFEQSGAGIASTLMALLDRPDVTFPLLVTTADHVLLGPAMLDQFVREAEGADMAVAMVERATLLARYPDSRRTWLKFRDGWWSGANLFWFGSVKARPVVALWQEVEQDRKKGWKILSAFGPVALLGAMLRISTLRGGIARVGRRFGLIARLVAMNRAEACIDADKPDDVALIERILGERRG
ncbi:4-diphosphocytidyl-2C-methyl-D-erythritol synthase [Sphingobium quisquiliarum P25]|uniref:4-diphosphocytidyl-2C-methyl-D-erythritol synthase n=1 Tax=Sphingobium quisquiliarum P25 TaxID=1329909 RepID=T0HB41_9SPHN|nr:NTP transferase domain-containing protein [Sphingobium quisquiliarum]EQB09318.1 4-diphosphocytidyl-2C-methyl-D-erythritol synthase [Sphingobium quisquiliarum P25]